MKKYFFIFLFLCTAGINAQRIILCKAFTDTGEPIDYIYSSTLAPDQSVCILFLGENKIIAGRTVHLNIDRVTGELRQNQLSKPFKTSVNNWLGYVHKFGGEGKFEIYVTDEKKRRFATLTINVAKQKSVRKTESISEIHYPEASVTFCERIESGKPVNPKRSVSLQLEAGSVYIFLNNAGPLNTEQIQLKTWRRDKTGPNYSEFTDSKKYRIDSQWNDAFFKYKFVKTGDYKIELYDRKELLIKTAYISVTN